MVTLVKASILEALRCSRPSCTVISGPSTGPGNTPSFVIPPQQGRSSVLPASPSSATNHVKSPTNWGRARHTAPRRSTVHAKAANVGTESDGLLCVGLKLFSMFSYFPVMEGQVWGHDPLTLH